MMIKLVKYSSAFVSSLLFLLVMQSANAQSVEVMPGLSYTVKVKSNTPNASVSEFVEYTAQLTGPDGKKISSKYMGNNTKPMQVLKTQYPALARMILLTPIGETRVWTLSADNLPPDVLGPKNASQLTLAVIATPDLLKTPSNLMLPPSTAIRTASGLRYVVLKKGTQTSHPLPTSTVNIDYSGWDRSGRLFDSSVERGEPATFALTGLIKGWQEGVLLMSPGDTFRFWIPGALAYDGSGGDAPKGQLVFDITLYDFKNTP
jgi:hypothetical protein